MSDTMMSGITTTLFRCSRCGVQQAEPTNWWLTTVGNERTLRLMPLADCIRPQSPTVFVAGPAAFVRVLCGDACLIADVSEFLERLRS